MHFIRFGLRALSVLPTRLIPLVLPLVLTLVLPLSGVKKGLDGCGLFERFSDGQLEIQGTLSLDA